ncbi:MAG TPA: HAD hydrolase-like protein [Candidatus Saccharimonadia bacterium]|nr:HAD hydrolase-like protein [Candidatus Saccharimonadia bacterium]
MSYQYILFDLDGTLCDPGPSITNSLDYALTKMGIDEPDKASLRRFVGPPLAQSFKDFYGFDDASAAEVIGIYREHFRVEGIRQYVPYPGMVELLDALKTQGKILAVATSKIDEFAQQILAQTGLTNYFVVVVGTHLGNILGKGATISEALEWLGNPPKSKAIMVGDREHDVIGAKENGIDSVGVLFGYGSREELEASGATYVAEDVGKVAELLSA